MAKKRLRQNTWIKIEKELQNPKKNMSRIARKFRISRQALYTHAWREEIIKRKKKKKSFWYRLWHSLPLVKLYYNE